MDDTVDAFVNHQEHVLLSAIQEVTNLAQTLDLLSLLVELNLSSLLQGFSLWTTWLSVTGLDTHTQEGGTHADSHFPPIGGQLK